MSAIPQITILVMACVIVLLISEMKCSHFITSRMEKKSLPRTCFDAGIPPPQTMCTRARTLSHPPVGQNRKPAKRALTNICSCLQTSDTSC